MTRSDRLVDKLKNAEMALLDPRVRADPRRLDVLLADDFIEVGSTGRVYDKQTLIAMLAGEDPAPVSVLEFSTRELTPEVALVTYRTVGQTGSTVRRSSVWVRTKGQWRVVFHQGTPLPSRWGPAI
jgi:hypothetical protein